MSFSPDSRSRSPSSEDEQVRQSDAPQSQRSLQDELTRLRLRAAAFEQSEATVEELERRIQAYEDSTFWRLTGPARRVLEHSPRLKYLLRGSARSCLGLVKGQLPGRRHDDRQTGETGAFHEETPAQPPAQVIPARRQNASHHAEDRTPLRFPRHAFPLLSIVIPSYGQIPVTLQCLRSIMRHPPSCPYEVIVAEDASGDPSVAGLRTIEGLVLIERTENLGFLKNCNEAAKAATGAWLHLLNNDTEVLSGTFDTLLARLQTDAGIGLTGSKLLYPDGRLQEAGGILWNDASGWNFGRNDPYPDRAAYSYPRDVDYISGASIMLRRDLFASLGGFDEAFAPAYYEDTDLAFRIRASGLRVVFEPASVVIHHEGVSHGTDESSGIKAYQVRNRELMLDRWREVLEAEHFPPATHFLRAACHAPDRRTILIIDHYVPEPDRDAGSRTTMNVIHALCNAGWLVKFWPENRQRNSYSCALERLGVEILDESCPYGFAAWIGENGPDLDHVMIMRPTVARAFLPDVALNTDASRSYYGHDIHFLRLKREAEVTGNRQTRQDARTMRRLETWLWPQFHAVLYLSHYEADLVRELAPNARPHAIVPFCFAPDRSVRPVTSGKTILFVGGFGHPPNVDAALWLVREIMPLVRGRAPDVRLILAGSKPAAEVRALASPDVTVTGFVSDEELVRLYATSRVAAVPLRFGAGVKHKVLEALHQGLPLVTTSVGAEGIVGLEDVAAVAETAALFAGALLALLEDDALWRERSDAGKELISEGYSPERFGEVLLGTLLE
ncbi:MAG: glycosyltransferase [Acetobacter aceti]|uniref:Glycosyl transferase n=1 Tax=Acetobacter aceti TaxID=435 RepID=A0A1U9KK20_ACEAC|nr:glycosyltransferase [Acetobacter aceti]AQS86150.1 glycosyl transferase [Acetobacter aceti]